MNASIPPQFAARPYTSAVWVLCAPIFIPAIGMTIIFAIWPDIRIGLTDAKTAETLGPVWTALALIHLLHFAALSYWSEHIGAGAFAGPVRTSSRWIVGALILGPVILILPNIIAGMVMGGVDGWEYNSDVDESVFEIQNWGPAYVIFAIVLAPIVEEMTFRGVALGAMIGRGIPPVMASVLASAAFTFLHTQYSIPALLVVFTAGLGFAWLRLASKSIIVPIVAHMAANGLIMYLQTLAPPAG